MVASTQVCAVVVLPLFYRPSQRGVPHAVARRSRLRTYGLLITVYLSCAVCVQALLIVTPPSCSKARFNLYSKAAPGRR